MVFCGARAFLRRYELIGRGLISIVVGSEKSLLRARTI